MKIVKSYQAEIQGANLQFDETIRIYRKALKFLVQVAHQEWESLKELTSKERVNLMEKLTHATKENPKPKYDFDVHFYKFPSYFRRSAIQEACGIISSYRSNLQNYEAERHQSISNGKKFKKKVPKLQVKHYKHPIFYKGNMFNKYDGREMLLKIYKKNDWVWTSVFLKKTDFNYLQKQQGKEQSPSLVKKGRKYYLQFPYEEKVDLNKTKLNDQTILAIDLGVNHSAVCSVIKSDGTVIGRHFINQPIEKDRMHHLIKRLRFKQKQSGRKAKFPKIWAKINGYNTQIVNDTVHQIGLLIEQYQIDCLVMEYLDFKGSKRNKDTAHKLLMWQYRTTQKKLESKAHQLGCRYRRVSARNTSALAFDGSGYLIRDDQNASLCTFKNGKQYNCDLNATYNIAARYFIRDYQKTISAKKWSQLEAKVPLIGRRTQCTWSTYRTLLEVAAAR